MDQMNKISICKYLIPAGKIVNVFQVIDDLAAVNDGEDDLELRYENR